VTGGRTIILTLTSETWVAAGATFDAARQAIINGLLSDGTYYTGWNDVILPNIPVTDVVRTSDTVVTITLSARAEYSITEAETITCTVPASALTLAAPLTAAETFVINPLEDYSSVAIGFADFDDGVTDVAFAVGSQLDIIDWDSYSGVGLVAANEITPTDAVYSPSLDRWVVVSNNGAGATSNPSTPNICTSDNNGITWTARAHAYSLATTSGINAIAWHPQYDVFVAGGDNLALQVSPDGEAWSLAAVDAAVLGTADIVSLMITPEASLYMYAALSGTDFLLRSPDLSLLPASNTWTPIPIAYPAATGSKLAASGDGAIVSIGTGVTNMEIARTVHGAASGSSVGTINTYNCVGLIYANDQWVAISDDFRLVTCNGDNESATIGNWSVPGSAMAANVTMSGIKYDQGDSITQGYGYIAYGINTTSGLGVIYTSPDLVTWTLRHTQTESVAIVALATKYPEDQLASTLLSFAPTYNGAQAPTIVGTSLADYISADNDTDCSGESETDLSVQMITGDCVINMVGRQSGTGSDQGSSAAADTDLFNLNEEPDSIRITVTEELLLGFPDGTKDLIYEAFVDGAFFTPVLNFNYGVQADARNTAVAIGLGEPVDKISRATLTVQFTFRKAGYNDLSVSYRVKASAESSVPS